MIKYENTSNWKEEHREIIKRTIPRDVYRLGQSNNFKNTVSKETVNSFDIFVSYCHIKKCFFVCDMRVHRLIHSGKIITLDAKTHYLKDSFTTKDIYCKYVNRYAKNGYESAYEKILIVGEDAFYEFCCYYEDYLKPSKYDSEYKDPVYYVNENGSLSIIDSKKANDNNREVDIILRYRRNPNFRKLVLEKYNYTCVVCGCKEPKILEAAHIKSVYDGGNDDVENGLCLCSNHHKLFDSGLLKIDFKNKSFECLSPAEMNSKWYEEALNKRRLKLIL